MRVQQHLKALNFSRVQQCINGHKSSNSNNNNEIFNAAGIMN